MSRIRGLSAGAAVLTLAASGCVLSAHTDTSAQDEVLATTSTTAARGDGDVAVATTSTSAPAPATAELLEGLPGASDLRAVLPTHTQGAFNGDAIFGNLPRLDLCGSGSELALLPPDTLVAGLFSDPQAGSSVALDLGHYPGDTGDAVMEAATPPEGCAGGALRPMAPSAEGGVGVGVLLVPPVPAPAGAPEDTVVTMADTTDGSAVVQEAWFHQGELVLRLQVAAADEPSVLVNFATVVGVVLPRFLDFTGAG